MPGTVIVLTAVDQQLRGYLSRFLSEISTGQYVGDCSARVRDAIWLRVTESVSGRGIGKAMMISPAANEQGFNVALCGYADREAVDLDGMIVIGTKTARSEQRTQPSKSKHWSNAYWWKKSRY
jgi:CRISPR-associated protein Cas2